MSYNVKFARINKNLTQEELCRLIGISRNRLSAIENGNFKSLNYEVMIKLSDALDVSVQELFFND